MASQNMSLLDEIKKVDERIKYPEERLGKELCQPFSPSSSGSRKLMYGTHAEHALPLIKSEIPLVQTGSENEFGRNSSSYVEANMRARVITKIDKFPNKPNFHYYVIVLREDGVLDVIEKVKYNYITESYGYLYDNKYLDSLKPGNYIDKDDVILSSMSFDKYHNRTDGVNTLIAYLACDNTMEDAILLSDTAANKFSSPLIKNVELIINDNDLLLNMYGSGRDYKVIPDIGEDIQHGILAAIRRENKEEAFFTQSVDRLGKIMMSDDKITTEGTVVNIDVYCNNPDNIRDSIYNTQLLRYWDDKIRMCQEIVSAVSNMMNAGKIAMSYKLEKLYTIAQMALDGNKFSRTKPFSNIGLDITVMEKSILQTGDKLANRYGGKGVIGKIIPEAMMPRIKLTGEHIEMIYNQATVINRLNMSQLFEYEINQISYCINQAIITNPSWDVSDCLKEVLDFIEIFNPRQANFYKDVIDNLSDDEIIAFIDNITTDKGIILSMLSVSDNVTIDKLAKAKKRFNYARLLEVECPIVDSTGKIRYVPTARPMVCGYEYIYRLKQYAKEKFSTTSLSSTNLRGENSRSKAASLYKGINTKTPIRFGEMETMASSHLGMDVVVFMLMINATSPLARRRVEELITSPTIDVDIKLGKNDTSRIVETLNAYLKAMGLKLTFTKKYIGLRPFLYNVLCKKITKPEDDKKKELRPFLNILTKEEKEKLYDKDGNIKVIVRADVANNKVSIRPCKDKPKK